MSDEAARPQGPALPRCPHCGGEHAPHLLKCPDTDLALPLEGRVLHGKFRFIRMLGKGGMASVWAAVNTSVDRTVAIKLIRHDAGRNEDTVARFRAEAKAAGRIRHPNVCEIIDFGLGPRGPYIVMERLRGQSVSQLVHTEERLDPALAVSIVRQALAGLEAAHRRGIIHRDLKPENLFVHQPEAGPPVVKIMDFGVSKLTDGTAEVHTEHGALLGTPEYMSPEQFKGAAHADARTDVWAMGAILYKLLTGETAFAGPSVAATLLMVTTDQPTPIPELVRGVPPELVAIVERCLDKDPERRFQSAQELTDELESFDLGTLDALVVAPPGEDEDSPTAPTLAVSGSRSSSDDDSGAGPRTDAGASAKAASTAEEPIPDDHGHDLRTTRPRSIVGPRIPSRPDRRAWLVIVLVTMVGAGVLYMLSRGPSRGADPTDPDAPAEVVAAAAEPPPTAAEPDPGAGPPTPGATPPARADSGGGTAPARDTAAAIEAGGSGAAEPHEVVDPDDDATTDGGTGPALEADELVELTDEPPSGPEDGGSSSTEAFDPSTPPPTPPGTNRVGRYITLQKPGPAGTQADARAYCKNLSKQAFVGVTEWKLASPTVAKKIAPKVKKGRYWTAALWQGKAVVISIPSRQTSSRSAEKSGPRPLCFARWP